MNAGARGFSGRGAGNSRGGGVGAEDLEGERAGVDILACW